MRPLHVLEIGPQIPPLDPHSCRDTLYLESEEGSASFLQYFAETLIKYLKLEGKGECKGEKNAKRVVKITFLLISDTPAGPNQSNP